MISNRNKYKLIESVLKNSSYRLNVLSPPNLYVESLNTKEVIWEYKEKAAQRESPY